MTSSYIYWPDEIKKYLESDREETNGSNINNISLMLSTNISLLLKFINYAKYEYFAYLFRYSETKLFCKLVYKIIYSPSFYIRKTRLLKIAQDDNYLCRCPYENHNLKVALFNRKKYENMLATIYPEDFYEEYFNSKVITRYITAFLKRYDPKDVWSGFECVKYVKNFKIVLKLVNNDNVNILTEENYFNIGNCLQLILIAQKMNYNFYVSIDHKKMKSIHGVRGWPNNFYMMAPLNFYLGLSVRKRKSKNIITHSGNFIEKLISLILSRFTNCNAQKLILYYV